jgi:hypothetical protein
MRRTGLFLFLCLSFLNRSFSQLTGTKNIPGDYATLQAAITALNTSGVGAGGVIFNVVAGNPQTAPAGGYVIGGTGSAILSGGGVTSSTKTVRIQGNSNSITAFSPQAAGNVNDAIIKLIGADWITITGFTIQENGGNTVTVEASNTMTEWGIALLHVSVTDGAQNNTIQGNTITMDRTYLNSFGVYSNARHSASAINTAENPTTTDGANSNNKIYANTISNVNYPIYFNGSGSSGTMDTGNDIGGSVSSDGNTLTNWGNGLVQSAFINAPAYMSGITVYHQNFENVSWNTLTSASVNQTSHIIGIARATPTGGPTASYTAQYSNNTITLTQASATANLYGIYTVGSTSGSLTISVTNNTIQNCSLTAASPSGSIYGIYNGVSCDAFLVTGNILKGFSGAGAGFFAAIDNAGFVFNTVTISNNQLGTAASGLFSMTGAMGNTYGIVNETSFSTTVINMNNNSLDKFSCASASLLVGIANLSSAGAVNMKNNQVGSLTGTWITCSAAQGGQIRGIYNGGTSAAAVIEISGNDITGINTPVSSGAQLFIWNNAIGASQTISNNTFTNIVSRSGGFIYFIRQSGAMASGASYTCNDNRIVGTYNKTLTGGQVFFMYADGGAVSGSTVTETGNNFSNVYLVGSPPLFGWCEQQGVSVTNGPTKTITGNTFSNITLEGGLAAVMYSWKGTNITCSNNTISNIKAPVTFGICVETISAAGTYTLNGNTISGLEATGAGNATAIIGGTQLTSVTVQNNIISNIKTSATNGTEAVGIDISGTSATFSGNTISDISSAGTGVSSGLILKGGGTALITNNQIHTLTNTASGTATSPRVHGLQIQSGTSVTAANNFIANLTAPSLGGADVLRGISVLSKAATTNYKLYYNSVYLNATSSATDFGTSAVFDSTSATATTAALDMIDNIFVNTSTPNGTGKTVAFRRSDATLNNYASTSNYNLYYSGTPGAAKLIFDDGTNSDQTITAFKARVSTRDVNSISAMPDFTSATDLHLVAALNCEIEGKGTPVSGYTADIDGSTRNATTPDIGADEFNGATAVTTLAGAVSTTVCNSRDISGATTFRTNTCSLIAKVQPSGASPVSGSVNTCVYIDPATMPTYNAEPYVQRHFDIEPVTNATTSTAKVTLYFTNAEFVTFNANNASWPDLPTVAGGGNSDPNRSNLRVTQYHGTANTSPSSPNQYTGTGELINPADADIVWNGNYWEVSFDVTGFSGFYVHTNLRWVLPVEVNYFKGSRQGSTHLLNWKLTCNSTPAVTVTLERSSSASGAFTPLYSVQATATRCNQPFDYADAQPMPGMNYYRVKMTDANGKITYTGIVALLNAVKGFDLVSIAPNPVVNDHLKLNATSAAAVKMELVVIDMQGRIVKRDAVNLGAGFSTTDIYLPELHSGTYSLYGITAEGRSSVLRFVKQ